MASAAVSLARPADDGVPAAARRGSGTPRRDTDDRQSTPGCFADRPPNIPPPKPIGHRTGPVSAIGFDHRSLAIGAATARTGAGAVRKFRASAPIAGDGANRANLHSLRLPPSGAGARHSLLRYCHDKPLGSLDGSVRPLYRSRRIERDLQQAFQRGERRLARVGVPLAGTLVEIGAAHRTKTPAGL